VKTAAFMPDPYEELSTIAIEGMDEASIWEVVRLACASGRPAIGRGDFQAKSLRSPLYAEIDNQGFERHTSIKGWPSGPERKAERKSLAQAIAAQTTYSRIP
jgi:hypothetical protein